MVTYIVVSLGKQRSAHGSLSAAKKSAKAAAKRTKVGHRISKEIVVASGAKGNPFVKQ